MASDKGKIKDFDSFVPENGGFFEKSEIFSKSKHQAISNSEYDDPRSIGWEISAIWVILVNPDVTIQPAHWVVASKGANPKLY